VLADKLDADWSQVKIVNPPVWDEKTSGSGSSRRLAYG
jgi:hypothetical protein